MKEGEYSWENEIIEDIEWRRRERERLSEQREEWWNENSDNIEKSDSELRK